MIKEEKVKKAIDILEIMKKMFLMIFTHMKVTMKQIIMMLLKL